MSYPLHLFGFYCLTVGQVNSDAVFRMRDKTSDLQGAGRQVIRCQRVRPPPSNSVWKRGDSGPPEHFHKSGSANWSGRVLHLPFSAKKLCDPGRLSRFDALTVGLGRIQIKRNAGIPCLEVMPLVFTARRPVSPDSFHPQTSPD